jgi:hypothetical protein
MIDVQIEFHPADEPAYVRPAQLPALPARGDKLIDGDDRRWLVSHTVMWTGTPPRQPHVVVGPEPAG